MSSILTIVAYAALIISIVSVVLAIRGKYPFYWIATVGIYIFSFIAGFSIGLITVGFVFIPLTLAIGYSFGWIQNNSHLIFFLSVGIIIGVLMVVYVDTTWLFYPLWLFLK